MACAALFAMVTQGAAAAGVAGLDGLLPHRAVYDLSLIKASDRSGITGMNGRIVYEVPAINVMALRYGFGS